jgi:hypothetical protein
VIGFPVDLAATEGAQCFGNKFVFVMLSDPSSINSLFTSSRLLVFFVFRQFFEQIKFHDRQGG